MCVYVYVYHVHMGAGGGQKRALDLKELKLQAAVSCLMWLLDAELRSSANGAGTLDHRPFQPWQRMPAKGALALRLPRQVSFDVSEPGILCSLSCSCDFVSQVPTS